MQPFSRETIVDRRQPSVRWTAVLAGAAVALGTWLVLQLLGSGIALSAIDHDALDDLRGIGVGSSAWSIIAVAIAMFAGGLLAARLAGQHEQRVAGLHGLLVWALTSIAGLVIVSSAIGALAPSRGADAVGPAPATREAVASTLEPINARLAIEAKPTLGVDEVMDASRKAITVDGYDRTRFITELDDRTALTRPEVEEVVRQLGDRAPALVFDAGQLGHHQARAVQRAHAGGSIFIIAALALLLGAAAAIGGSLVFARDLLRRRDRSSVDRAVPEHVTAPYPVPPAPALGADDDDRLP